MWVPWGQGPSVFSISHTGLGPDKDLELHTPVLGPASVDMLFWPLPNDTDFPCPPPCSQHGLDFKGVSPPPPPPVCPFRFGLVPPSVLSPPLTSSPYTVPFPSSEKHQAPSIYFWRYHPTSYMDGFALAGVFVFIDILNWLKVEKTLSMLYLHGNGLLCARDYWAFSNLLQFSEDCLRICSKLFFQRDKGSCLPG